MVLPGISLYNQDRLSDDAFVGNFVARQDVLAVLLNMLRHAADGQTEHQVLIGPRGMGKTSLLRRLAIAIDRDSELRSQFIPLRFREEQYNVIALSTFWRNCGEALAEWCEVNGYEALADSLDRAIDSREWRHAETAADRFLEFCEKLDRRPCLLLDNLDLVLAGLKNEGWLLRNTLQKRGGPVVIGAAAHLLKQGANRKAPFYEFFNPIFLEPLSEGELLHCMHALASRRGPAGESVKQVLATTPERIRTLYTLTGGNPRILVLIYQLLERAETETIFADLEALLDQVTPFYKARIEEYQAPQQRAVIDAIALNWDPITSSSLSDVTGIPVTTISSQLNKLRKDAFIEQVPSSGARDAYQLGERFLNIWYLMRHGTRKTKQRLRWLTIFLTKLFTSDELGRMAAQAIDTASKEKWHPDYRAAVIEAFWVVQSLSSLLSQSMSQPEASFSEPTSMVATDVEKSSKGQPSLDALTHASELLQQGEYSEAVATFEDAVRHLSDAAEPMSHQVVAIALTSKAIALHQLGRLEEALAANEEAMHHFGDATEPRLQPAVAIALAGKAAAFGQLGRPEQALAAYDEVVQRFGGVTEPDLWQHVAVASVGKAFALSQLGRLEDALAAFEEALQRFSNADDLNLQEHVLKALAGKGVVLDQLGRPEEALAAYDEAVRRFGDVTEPPLQPIIGIAYASKAAALSQFGRLEEALTTYDEAMNRIGDATEPHLREGVAAILTSKAIILDQLGRLEEAIATDEEVVHRFGDAAEINLRERVVYALGRRAIVFGQLNRLEEALATYEDAVRRFGDAIEPELQRRIATVFTSKAVVLDQLGRPEEALAAYEEAARRFDDVIEPKLQPAIAIALDGKAAALGLLGRPEEALAVYEEVVRRFSDAIEPDLQDQVAKALSQKGRILYDSFGQYARAEDFFRQALRVKANLNAQANLIWSLIAQARTGEAIALRTQLSGIAPEGLSLMDAGIEMSQDNVGNALEHFGEALAAQLEQGRSAYFEDILWFLRFATDRGHGERTIEWFATSNHSERYAPIYAALIAFVRGERFLNDVNPEARPSAQRFYETLSAPNRHRSRPVMVLNRRRAKRTQSTH